MITDGRRDEWELDDGRMGQDEMVDDGMVYGMVGDRWWMVGDE